MAEPFAALDAQQEARRLYSLLTPHAGQGGYFARFSAPIDLSLGLLARTSGDETAARSHFTEALDFATQLGAPLVAARCRDLLARPAVNVVPHPRPDVTAARNG